jgi:hypothetical protein
MQKFFLAFIVLSGILSIFFINKTFWELKKYLSLNEKTKAEVTNLEIRETKKGKFLISATYSYNVKDKKLINKTIFKKPTFLNHFAAFAFLKKRAKEDFYAWYSSKNIKNSSLEKYFPIKNFIYAIISVAIFLYFILFFKRLRKFE